MASMNVTGETNDTASNELTNQQTEILEYGDIYFFYRPKVRSEQVKSIDDVRRFFMITAPEAKDKHVYRLFLIGKKSLPEIRKSEARASERYWARVGGIFENPSELTKELVSDEFRKGDVARPVGEGKYTIVKYQNHAELAYILEIPNELGDAQKELGIEKEASYVISVINPKIPSPAGYPSTEETPKYPEQVLKELNNTENFIPLSRDTKLIDYQNAQIILIGAREGPDIIKNEIGVEINYDKDGTKESSSADIFTKLKVRKDQVPTRPLIEGTLE
ncbi:MAG: hypothetical protein WBZ36_30165 [Candidatus Nitrosopolaris sp.]